MSSKPLRYAFNEAIKHLEAARCEHLHHKAPQHHEANEICPVEYALQKQAHILREYMKEQGI